MIFCMLFSLIFGFIVGWIAAGLIHADDVKMPGYKTFLKYGKYTFYMTTSSYDTYKKMNSNDRLNLEAHIYKCVADEVKMKDHSNKLLIFFVFNTDTQMYSAKIDDMK